MYNKLFYKAYILNAKAANGVGTALDVRDKSRVVFSVGSASSANLTLKIQGANALPGSPTTPPDFAAARTVANHWDYVEVIDAEDGSPIDGDIGLAFSGTDDFRLFILNTENIDYVNCEVSSRVAGTVTVWATCTNNA